MRIATTTPKTFDVKNKTIKRESPLIAREKTTVLSGGPDVTAEISSRVSHDPSSCHVVQQTYV